jgi:hypothetical protein
MKARYARPTLPDVVVDVPEFGLCRPIDLWDVCLYAQAEVDLAFQAWTTAPTGERGDHYAVYRAALDREEQAAATLVALLHRDR